MQSQNKLKIITELVSFNGESPKEWVKVIIITSSGGVARNVFYPSFEDLYRIVRAICDCEDQKYPNGKGKWMVDEFLASAVVGIPFSELKTKFQIPDR